MISTPITTTAVWLRRIGDEIQVLVEVDGEWRVAITELADTNFSHIAEGNGAYLWPADHISNSAQESSI